MLAKIIFTAGNRKLHEQWLNEFSIYFFTQKFWKKSRLYSVIKNWDSVCSTLLSLSSILRKSLFILIQ